ncbi:hypothetical protein BS78_K153300 [Paspalum vaginatum]|uniref:MBD domain-containing protein n=1 Tax=Paspalum vaginatum TaxID=158149 RepID=A0A9W7XBB7_9POAL|nr:hypothetical protein BS78_K153300 [Paspalum vaginatum]KAJ1255831.1 hypothetical protein BS78_K153300 [Paspalum vaginatum]
MESNQVSSMASPTENSEWPPSRKRQKMLSGKDGDQPNNKQKKPSKRASPKGIRHFAVQCENCEKWRFVPSKKQYEVIRERIEKEPFVCENACEWKPDVTCDDPPDVCQDGSKLWVIDEPNVEKTPQGWERLVKLRNEGGAYVHYKPPIGRQLRSLDDVNRYLDANPEYAKGVEESQFSFKIPKILEQDIRKHPRESQSDISDTGSTRLQPDEGDV